LLRFKRAAPFSTGRIRQRHTAKALRRNHPNKPAFCYWFADELRHAPFQPHRGFDQHTLTALDHQPYGCIKLDKTGRVSELNIAASALLGIRSADALGKCFFTRVALSAGADAFYCQFKAAMAGNGVLNKALDHQFELGNAPLAIPAMVVRVHMFFSVDSAGLPVVWVVTRKKVVTTLLGLSGSSPDAQAGSSAASGAAALQHRSIQDISSEFDTCVWVGRRGCKTP
jgi:photoactive yellow protein